MNHLVSLSLGAGSCQLGFQTVTVQLWSDLTALPVKFSGSLPPAPELIELYDRWQALYQALHHRLDLSGNEASPNRSLTSDLSKIQFAPQGINNISEAEFERVNQNLQIALNTWLQSEDFFSIDQRLRLRLDPSASIQFIVETDDRLLRHLPWHLWNLLEYCAQAEVAFSAQEYEQAPIAFPVTTQPPRKSVRVLAILGNSHGIDIQKDRALLEQLPQVESVFLSEPSRSELNQSLWDSQGWDIVFFAGHSTSHHNTGRLFINPTESITVEQLRHALKAAIAQGLKLAIFNSCDGLGLAQALESLNLPQLIVMREPVPDRVAHVFLQNFLQALAQGIAFYPALRRAREQLQGIEGEYPGASWLPTLCQNPAAPSFSWPDLAGTAETLEAQRRIGDQQQTGQQQTGQQQTKALALATNPYQGLAAFCEADSDRYFGRDREVQTLWEQFQQLYKSPNTTRLIPIYGPSGSGKSSLARAGLLGKLQQQTQRKQSLYQIITFVPGMQPLHALAKALAQVLTEDAAPVRKIREFSEELTVADNAGNYDGLQRIAQLLPKIETHPLVILIDQCEEIYSLCEDGTERDILIGNLLYAAQHRSQQVSVIITFRSDFLGETHQHPSLNRLFAQQGVLVPAMDKENLREAIARPAQQAGYPLDDATINLLIEQTEGRDGALPLLQFALTQIWEGFSQNIPSAQMLQDIGGVGGALAGEAQRIYNELPKEEQDIARRLFLGLVQLGEGTRDTRRRTTLDELIAVQDDTGQVRQVINQFSAPGVRLITLAIAGDSETIEVTHEALFDHWQQLNHWVEAGRDDLRFQRRLDEAAKDWSTHRRPDGLLWRKPNLDLLRSYHQRCQTDMTPLQVDFFSESQRSENQQKIFNRIAIGMLLLLTTAMTGFGMAASRNAAEAKRAKQIAQARQFIVQSEQLTDQSGISTQQLGALLAVQAVKIFQTIEMERPIEIDHALYKSLLVPRMVVESSDSAWMSHVAISPDGQQLATASNEKQVKVWEIPSRKMLAEFPHDASINGVVFHPNSSQIATASEDGIARVWDIQSQKHLAKLPHGGAVNGVAFHPDGTQVATASGNNMAQIWDLQAQKVVTSFPHETSVQQVLFSPDASRIATVSVNRPVQIWAVDRQSILFSLPHAASVNAIAFNSDGSQLVSASADGMTRLWDLQTQTILAELSSDGSASSVAFSPDDKTVAISSSEGTTGVWDIQSNRLLSDLPHDTWVNQLTFSPDGQQVATASSDGTTQLWNIAAWQAIDVLPHQASVSAIALSPDGKKLATAGTDGMGRIWDLETGQVSQVQPHRENIWGLAFSPDGRKVATASTDGTAKIWEIDKGKVLASFNHQGGVFDVDFSPDGTEVVTGAADGTARIWDIQTGEIVTTYSHQGPIFSVEFSPDGQQVASGGSEDAAKIWDSQTGKLLIKFPQNTSTIHVGFNSDGSQLATAGDDYIARIWNTTTEEIVHQFRHEDTVLGVSFSSDDTKLATASDDGTAGIWDLKTGQRLTSLPHEGQVIKAVFSLDGSQVITGSFDKMARIWSYQSSAKLADTVCQRIGQNFSARNWKRYLDLPLSEYELSCKNLPVHSSVLLEVKRLAIEGERKEALKIYRQLLQIAPDTDLDPSTREVEQDPVSLIKGLVNAEPEQET